MKTDTEILWEESKRLLAEGDKLWAERDDNRSRAAEISRLWGEGGKMWMKGFKLLKFIKET